MASGRKIRDRASGYLIGVIGDEVGLNPDIFLCLELAKALTHFYTRICFAASGLQDTATGFLLAGVGQNEPNKSSNYFVVDPSKNLLSCHSYHIFLPEELIA